MSTQDIVNQIIEQLPPGEFNTTNQFSQLPALITAIVTIMSNGIVGPPGPIGPIGLTGPAATIQPGTTTTSAPGTSAQVTNSGSEYNAVFNFVIPQGEPGANGTNGNTVWNGVGPPSSSLGVIGDFYIDTNAWNIYGPKTASGWSSGTPLVSQGVLSGTIAQFPCATPPAGYLQCNGALLSRTTYANLWAFANASGNIVTDAVWTAGGVYASFSSGDGATTFRLPDLRGLDLIGTGQNTSANFSNYALGASGGENNHVLVTGELASHSHTGSVSGNTGTESANHTHASPSGTNFVTDGSGTVYGGGGLGIREASTTTENTTHYHGFSGSFTTATAGSGTAHNNMQPYGVVMTCIKF